jgi:Ser/Thr protein kinase RdoA (MazF antagonist)
MAGDRSVRIRGDVVIRPRKPWTPTVQALLAHLYARGLPVPEPLGYDDREEQVRFLPGDAGDDAWPHQLGLGGVRSAGALLRQLHDASADWRPPATARWSVPFDAGPVVCHGDPQPANFAWRDGRAVGLFDWDGARPGDPVSDVAYALLWFTPFNADEVELRRRGFTGAPNLSSRAEALLDGYGWSEPIDVVDTAVTRHARAIDEVVWLGARGHEPHASWVAAGWPERWRADLDAMRSTTL